MRLLEKGTKVGVIDPSELLRPEPAFAAKPVGDFRDFSIDENDPIKERVRKLYIKMHTGQTVDFVKSRHDKWLKFDKFEAGVLEVLEKLNDLVDESDPDVDLPNIYHGFQTAERIRADHPDLEWFQLTGLIHDIGKVMFFYGGSFSSTTGHVLLLQVLFFYCKSCSSAVGHVLLRLVMFFCGRSCSSTAGHVLRWVMFFYDRSCFSTASLVLLLQVMFFCGRSCSSTVGHVLLRQVMFFYCKSCSYAAGHVLRWVLFYGGSFSTAGHVLLRQAMF
ncbi:uncharacterized protein LOC134541623 isoform X2 [Bacillus rossius redtenbacheri]|uniref:uncharacterized protein LOC134541623 isoform X2 n=1 Tax=Bacillus rossius redtenbacheri TaxID=93214 RepID=UPI002FDD0766